MILEPWLAVVLATMFAGCGIVIGALLTRVHLDLAYHRLEAIGDRASASGRASSQVAPLGTSAGGWDHPPSEEELEVYLRGQAGDE